MLTEKKPSPIEMAPAAVTVVVVAPVCEEIVFRLLLQGFLESWEFKLMCRRESVTAESNRDKPQEVLEPIGGEELKLANPEPCHRGFEVD